MKKILKIGSISTFCLMFMVKANAFIISADMDLPTGATYTDTGPSVISVNTTNANTPWKLTTGGNVILNLANSGIRSESGGMLDVSGYTGTEKLIIQNANITRAILGINVRDANGIINLKDINYIINNNKFSGNSSAFEVFGSSAKSSVYNSNIELTSNTAAASGIRVVYTRAASGGFELIGNINGENYVKVDGNISTISGGYVVGFYGAEKIKIENVDITYTNNNAYNINYLIYNNATTFNILGSSDRNKIISRDNTSINGDVYVAFINGGETYIKDMDIYFNSGKFARVIIGGEISLVNSTVNAENNNDLFVSDNGTSNISISSNSNIFTSTGSLLSVDNNAASNININASNVSGMITTAVGSTSNIKLENDSQWNIQQSSNVTNLTNNNSLIDMRNSVLGQFNTLTTSNYVSSSGSIIMNAELGDDASLTDRLVINGGGNITGSTEIEAIIVGSNGNVPEDNGIKIVSAENGTTINNDVFSLKGGQVDNSAYIYKLYQGDVDGLDSQSWYLRSTGALSNTAMAIANEPTAIVLIAKTGMNSLQKRMGELRENTSENLNGLWVRVYGKDMRVKDKISTDFALFGTEAGYDHRWDFAGYKVYAGAMIGYMNVDDIKNKQYNSAKDGTGDGDAYSIGVYGTVLYQNGWFIDGVIRNFWEDLDLTNYTASNLPVKYSLDRMMTAYSVEVGKQYKVCIDCNSMYIIEPKVELMYAHADAKNFTSNYGNHIRYGNTDAFSTKAALMLGYKRKLESGKIIEPFIQAGIIEEWTGTTNVIYDGAKYKSDMSGTSLEFGGGLNMQITKSGSFYSDIMYEIGSNVRAISGNIGVRYTW
jgi:outer membrane autotransporter protein